MMELKTVMNGKWHSFLVTLAEITASNVAPIPLHSAKNTSKKVTKRSTNKFGKTTIKF